MLACDAVASPRRLVSAKRPLTLAPVRPNAGHRAAYEARLDALIAEMNRSLVYWLRAAYRARPPEMAQDSSPARTMQAAFRKLARRWQDRFDKAAPELAQWFARGVSDRSDAALRGVLNRAGFAIEFKMTAPMNDALQATIGEQVGLIKSIASQHLSEVEGLVNRSVAAGRDLGALTSELERRYGLTRNRAAFIARDQNNKSTAVLTRVRQTGLGIREAIWVHSAGGRKPRVSHVKAGKDGLRYEVAKGALIDGDYILPGELPNCRCVSRSIIPGLS